MAFSWVIITVALRTLDYGDYGLFLISGNAGYISSAVAPLAAKAQQPGQASEKTRFIRFGA